MQAPGIILSLIFLATCVLAGPTTPRKDVSPPVVDTKYYRLPKNIKPLQYDVTLETRLDPEFNFNGSVVIHLTPLENTKNITLHHRRLRIKDDSIKVHDSSANDVNHLKPEYNKELEQYTIFFDKDLKKDLKYFLFIEFEGDLDRNMDGFYRSFYKKGETIEWLASTQFESTSARMAFPCFDEPHLKAVFRLTLINDKKYSAISNMPIKATDKVDYNDTLISTEFDDTPLMSTYLLAFVISKYEHKSNGPDFEVYAEKDDLETAEYAKTKGKEILQSLETYLGIKFEIPVMKQIGIPDFAAGAMENWGLVTYRETRLLYKEGHSTMSDKKAVACVIAHEFGHQWFGNLVSPEWWEYIWLNEGFATFFEYFAADKVEKEWRLMEQYVVDTLQSIFAADSLETTRPMNYGVQSPQQIKSVFDGIAYDKAGTVIRMMQHALTDAVFSKGLNTYLNNKNHSHANPKNLYDGLQTQVAKVEGTLPKDLTVEKIMDSWANQKGYPVITVERNYEKNTATIKQEHFLLNKKVVDDKQFWWVPINYASAKETSFDETKPTFWLDNTGKPFTFNLTETEEDWIIFNKQQTGYYRVNYDETNWKLITNVLKTKDQMKKIHPVNRAQLIDDALNLARSGRLPYSTAMQLVTYLADEDDYIPWVSANNGLMYLDRLLANSEGYDDFKKLVSVAVDGLYKSTGFDVKPEDKQDKIFARNIALTWACKYDILECRQKSSEKYESWKNGTAVSADLQKLVYCNVLRMNKNSSAEWDYLWNKYTNSTVASEKVLLLSALGCTENEDLLKGYLDKSLNDTKIRDQDRASVMSAVYTSGPVGLKVALAYVGEKLFEVNAKYSVGSVLSGISTRLTTETEKKQIEKIINDHKDDPKFESIKASAESALKNVNDNMNWLKEHEETIAGWMADHHRGSAHKFSGSILITIAICMFAYLI